MDVELQVKQEPEQNEETNRSFAKQSRAFSGVHSTPPLANYGLNNVNYSRPAAYGYNQAPTPQALYDAPIQAQDQASRLQVFYNEQLNRLQAYYRPGERAQGFYAQQATQQVFNKFVGAKQAQVSNEGTTKSDQTVVSKYRTHDGEDADPLDMSINTAAFCEAVIEPQTVKREVELLLEKQKQNQLAAKRTSRPGFEFVTRTGRPPVSVVTNVMSTPPKPPGCPMKPRPVPAEKTHLCTVCNARFTQSSHLNTHRRQHTGEKPYACESCPARFNQSAHLTTHRRKHTGERPYVCDQCPANFTQSDSLTKHKRQHTGEKPYPCQQCDARFTQPSSLTRHNRLHAGEKPYACNECEARFNTSSHLTRHKLQHTGEKPYGCTDCEARFTQRIHLITHRRQHTGEKPFACTDCSARFAQKSNLVSHKRTHTGYKPHQCSRCLKRFARLSYVKLHAQTCHSQHGVV